MKVQLIRNATIRLDYGNNVFLIDPFFAEKHTLASFAGRSKNPTVDLPYPIAQILEGVDHVLISHLHPDHFDAVAQKVLPKNIPIWCQPADADPLRSMGFTQVSHVNDSVTIGSTEIIRTTGQHGAGKILNFMGEASGFLFRHPSEKTLYLTGDTIWYEEVQKVIDLYSPEIIICHAGGNRFFKEHNIFGEHFREDSPVLIMDTEQVLQLCRYASNSQIVAVHLEALDHETVTRPALRQYMNEHVKLNERLLIPVDGEVLRF